MSNPDDLGPSVCQQLAYLPSIISVYLHRLDAGISTSQNSISSLTRSNPLRTLMVQRLGIARFQRYELSGQQADLEQSIIHFTEAIFLQHHGDIQPSFLNMAQKFYHLTFPTFFRVAKSRQPEDVKFCVRYLRYLREQWHDVPLKIFQPRPVTATLVRALAIQVELGLGIMGQDIEEMAGLCGELLESDISPEPIVDFATTASVNASVNRPAHGGFPFQKVIDCLRMATTRLLGLHTVSIALAACLYERFFRAPSDDDHEEGMTIVDDIIMSHAPDDRPNQCMQQAMVLAYKFSETRFYIYGKPEDLEQAIYRTRALLDKVHPSLEDPMHAGLTERISHLQMLRQGEPERQKTWSDTSAPDKLPSFRDLNTSVPEPRHLLLLKRLTEAFDPSTTLRLTDMEEIANAIKYCQEFRVLYPHNKFEFMARITLAYLFFNAFTLTHQAEYLDEACSIARDDINTSSSQTSHVLSLRLLILVLQARLRFFHRGEDLDELIRLFLMAAKHDNITTADKLEISHQWVSTARDFGHYSISTAYDHAMLLIQASVVYAPTLDRQHSRFVAKNEVFKTIPLDYASHQIQTNQIEQAVETLERGRALLWSEMRGLRTSIDQITLVDPHLADEFATINRELETLTFAFAPNDDAYVGSSDDEGMDSFGQLVVRQRKLLDDRAKLISRIQALPGFDTFLKPPAFDGLRSAASHGPVIIINHSDWRSDIIILLHNSPPSLIPTSDGFYARAIELQDQLLRERKNGLESNEYEGTLRSVLKELYEIVGQPVIKRLNELNVPEQSRVWWCPTSVFCSLPLHAMGPIPSDGGPPRYFLDLYIPSYIPSLSALIESRKHSSQAIRKPSILLVAHPDEKMPQALKEMKVVQAIDTQVTTLFSAKAKPTAALAHLRDHRFAHIVCHGILEPGKPFEASFRLHRGERLLLLDIVRSQLPNAEFAFLSACHTAELTEESIADEVLHLAAAMQFCGFRSVVGTMWAMADIDGRDLAGSFYESLFSNGAQGVRYFERTAAALRDAVRELRRKGGTTLERWVNFIHYGA